MKLKLFILLQIIDNFKKLGLHLYTGCITTFGTKLTVSSSITVLTYT